MVAHHAMLELQCESWFSLLSTQLPANTPAAPVGDLYGALELLAHGVCLA